MDIAVLFFGICRVQSRIEIHPLTISCYRQCLHRRSDAIVIGKCNKCSLWPQYYWQYQSAVLRQYMPSPLLQQLHLDEAWIGQLLIFPFYCFLCHVQFWLPYLIYDINIFWYWISPSRWVFAQSPIYDICTKAMFLVLVLQVNLHQKRHQTGFHQNSWWFKINRKLGLQQVGSGETLHRVKMHQKRRCTANQPKLPHWVKAAWKTLELEIDFFERHI